MGIRGIVFCRGGGVGGRGDAVVKDRWKKCKSRASVLGRGQGEKLEVSRRGGKKLLGNGAYPVGSEKGTKLTPLGGMGIPLGFPKKRGKNYFRFNFRSQNRGEKKLQLWVGARALQQLRPQGARVWKKKKG